MSRARVILAVEDDEFRRVLRARLRLPTCDVVGEYADLAAMLDGHAHLRADRVIVDWPPEQEIRLVGDLRSGSPDLEVVAVVDDADVARLVLDAGAATTFRREDVVELVAHAGRPTRRQT